MTWFRMDDHCWSHPKMIRLSSVAFGVWARIGSYCADQLTDGLVETETVHSICPESRTVINRAVAELVAAGLWEPQPHGHSYHDWADHQPTRAEVMAARAASRERQRKAREKWRAETQEGSVVTPISRDRRAE
jgi:hypothetical protein